MFRADQQAVVEGMKQEKGNIFLRKTSSYGKFQLWNCGRTSVQYLYFPYTSAISTSTGVERFMKLRQQRREIRHNSTQLRLLRENKVLLTSNRRVFMWVSRVAIHFVY